MKPLVKRNSKQIFSWKPLISKLKGRLAHWTCRSLNFGGRITLLSSMLSGILVFMLSFFRAPVTICKETSQIQNNFLWCSIEDTMRIHWIGWNNIYRSVALGGLGLKRIDEFNFVLLLKWKWRLLKGAFLMGTDFKG